MHQPLTDKGAESSPSILASSKTDRVKKDTIALTDNVTMRTFIKYVTLKALDREKYQW